MPKVSIVIPAYNAMAFLPQTVDSILAQTWQDYEVVIINDGSQDNILTWSQTLIDPRIRVFSQDNKGLAGARNSGIQHSEGEYIAFLDADDLWQPTKLEKQVQLLDQQPSIGLVYTWVASINELGMITGRVFQHTDRGHIWSTLITHNIVECGSNALVRRRCFDRHGLFDTSLRSYVEDWDMWLRIAQTEEFDVVQEPLVMYRQHAASASQNWSAMEASFQQVIAKAFEQPPVDQPDLKGQALAFAYMCLAWKPLQSKTLDIQQAIAFQRQARLYYPSLRNTKEDLRLSIAIFLMRSLGPDYYNMILSAGRSLRRQLFPVSSSL